MELPLILITALLGTAVLSSYGLVLANVGDAFPLTDAPSHLTYNNSPYWLGMRREAIIAIIMLQVFAGVGFLMWFGWLAFDGAQRGILRTPTARVVLMSVFLGASIAWPYATYFHLSRPSLSRAIGSAACLWLAALAIIVAIGGTFEADAPAYAVVGILLLGQVVVLADGVGWSAVVIWRQLYES